MIFVFAVQDYQLVTITNLLMEQPSVDSTSVRVRLLRLGAFSLDVDVFAYVSARDWNHFLEIQEELLLRIMETVQQTGAEIAFPSQTMYLATDSSEKAARSTEALALERRSVADRVEASLHSEGQGAA